MQKFFVSLGTVERFCGSASIVYRNYSNGLAVQSAYGAALFERRIERVIE
jgi:hypothetical protein